VSDLKLIANELVPVYENDNKDHMVNARDLHANLKSNRQFGNWIAERIEKYDLQEGTEYLTTLLKNQNGAGRPKKEYYLMLDTAKEMAMVENNEQGKKVRQYFIAVEKKVREMFTIPKSLPEALRMAAELAEKIEADKPKVLFAETCLGSNDSILIRELAKVCSKRGKVIGQNNLFRQLRKWNILNSNNEPYQEYIERGYFEVVERPIHTSDGTILKLTTKVLPKGQAYILNKICAN
jgi:anti-repressor protein